MREVEKTFGTPFASPVDERLVRMDLTRWWGEGLMLAWAPEQRAKSTIVHRLVEPAFERVFAKLEEWGCLDHVKTFGGVYNYRKKTGGHEWSTHAWAIAIDLNCGTNAFGQKGDMSVAVVEAFEENYFEWGGRWMRRGPDSMHFQYCRSY